MTKTTISWTEETIIVDRGGRRVRVYRRKTPGPNKQERRRHELLGERWCRGCEAWLPSADVRKGACRTHQNEEYRKHYAGRGGPNIRARVYARKRSLDALPPEAAEFIRDREEGRCIYCGSPANTFDHLVPVKRGGKTTPGNIVLACVSCNSSKKDRDLDEWLSRIPITDDLFDVIALAAEKGVL